MKDRLHRYALCMLSAGLLSLALFHNPAHADLVTTDQIAAQEQARQERDRVKASIGRADIAKQLQALGVPPEDAQARVDAMTAEEIRNIAGELDTLPAGGVLGTKELIIVVLLAILIALLI